MKVSPYPPKSGKNEWGNVAEFLKFLTDSYWSTYPQCSVHFSIHPESLPLSSDDQDRFEEEFLDTDTFDLMKKDWWLKKKYVILPNGNKTLVKLSLKERTSYANTHTVYTEINDESQIIQKLGKDFSSLKRFTTIRFRRILEQSFYGNAITMHVDECILPNNATYFVGSIRFRTPVNDILSAASDYIASKKVFQEMTKIIYPARSKITEMMYQDPMLRYYYFQNLMVYNTVQQTAYNGYYLLPDKSVTTLLTIKAPSGTLISALPKDFKETVADKFIEEQFVDIDETKSWGSFE